MAMSKATAMLAGLAPPVCNCGAYICLRDLQEGKDTCPGCRRYPIGTEVGLFSRSGRWIITGHTPDSVVGLIVRLYRKSDRHELSVPEYDVDSTPIAPIIPSGPNNVVFVPFPEETQDFSNLIPQFDAVKYEGEKITAVWKFHTLTAARACARHWSLVSGVVVAVERHSPKREYPTTATEGWDGGEQLFSEFAD